VSERLLASQEGLGSMELAGWLVSFRNVLFTALKCTISFGKNFKCCLIISKNWKLHYVQSFRDLKFHWARLRCRSKRKITALLSTPNINVCSLGLAMVSVQTRMASGEKNLQVIHPFPGGQR
jgi:hypothetical protein